MTTYRQKPVEVEAMRLDGDTVGVCRWLASHGVDYRTWTHAFDARADVVYIKTPSGDLVASPGDWIVRGVTGDFFPCKPDIFEATFEATA